MALKFIQQDATTLRAAYQERKAEYTPCEQRGDGRAQFYTVGHCLSWR